MKKIIVLLFIAALNSTSLLVAQQDPTASDSIAHTIEKKPKLPKPKPELPPQKQPKNNSNSVVVDSLTRHIDSLENDVIIRCREERDRLLKQVDSLEQCLSSVASMQAAMQKALNDGIVSQFGTHLRNAHLFFCRAVLTVPLYYKYNKEHVNWCLDMAKAMGYDKSVKELEALGYKHDDAEFIHTMYDLYHDLLANYETYYNELIKNMHPVSFDLQYRDLMTQEFEDRWKKTEYTNKVKEKKGLSKKIPGWEGEDPCIFYINYQVTRLKTDYYGKKENFNEEKFDELKNFYQN